SHLAIPRETDRAAHEEAVAQYRAQAGPRQKELDALEAPYRETLHAKKLARLSEDAQLAHQTPREKRTKEQEGTVAETAPMLKFTDIELAATMSADDQFRRQRLLKALSRIPKPPALP